MVALNCLDMGMGKRHREGSCVVCNMGVAPVKALSAAASAPHGAGNCSSSSARVVTAAIRCGTCSSRRLRWAHGGSNAGGVAAALTVRGPQAMRRWYYHLALPIAAT